MAALLRMPEVAAGAESAILAGWSVAEHATFSTGDMIAVVETDKAVVDIEAETDGVLLRTLVPGGTRVAVGDPIALIGSPDESVTDIDAALSELGYAVSPAAVSPAAVSPASQSSSSASPPSTLPTSAGRGPGAAQEGTGAAEEAHGIPDPQSPPRRLFASPLVRRLAKEAGLDLAGIRGSGPHGRIVKRDLAAARAQAAGAAAAGAAAGVG
jgi:pyruvate dehydrogenase E2 component (dihydrolipoamide acetyltransferase)